MSHLLDLRPAYFVSLLTSILIRRWNVSPSGIVLAAMNNTYSGLLTMARCDTACMAEVAAVLAPVSGQPAVQGIINSGGVLADAMIPSQTAAGMRYATYFMVFKMETARIQNLADISLPAECFPKHLLINLRL